MKLKMPKMKEEGYWRKLFTLWLLFTFEVITERVLALTADGTSVKV